MMPKRIVGATSAAASIKHRGSAEQQRGSASARHAVENPVCQALDGAVRPEPRLGAGVGRGLLGGGGGVRAAGDDDERLSVPPALEAEGVTLCRVSRKWRRVVCGKEDCSVLRRVRRAPHQARALPARRPVVPRRQNRCAQPRLGEGLRDASQAVTLVENTLHSEL